MAVAIKDTYQMIDRRKFVTAHVNIGHKLIVTTTILSTRQVREIIQIRAAGDNVGIICYTAALQRIALRCAVPHIVRPLSGKRHIVRGHGVEATCLIGVRAVAPAGEIHAVIGVRICRKGDFSACGNSFLCRSSTGCAGVAAGKGNSKFRLNRQVDGDGFRFLRTFERQHDFADDVAGLAIVFAIGGIILDKRLRCRPFCFNFLIGNAVGNSLQYLVCGGIVADLHFLKYRFSGIFHIRQCLLSKSVFAALGFWAVLIGVIAECLYTERVTASFRDAGSKVMFGFFSCDGIALCLVILVKLYAVLACIVHSIPDSLAGVCGIPCGIGRCGQSNLVKGFVQCNRTEAI